MSHRKINRIIFQTREIIYDRYNIKKEHSLSQKWGYTSRDKSKEASLNSPFRSESNEIVNDVTNHADDLNGSSDGTTINGVHPPNVFKQQVETESSTKLSTLPNCSFAGSTSNLIQYFETKRKNKIRFLSNRLKHSLPISSSCLLNRTVGFDKGHLADLAEAEELFLKKLEHELKLLTISVGE